MAAQNKRDKVCRRAWSWRRAAVQLKMTWRVSAEGEDSTWAISCWRIGLGAIAVRVRAKRVRLLLGRLLLEAVRMEGDRRE